MDRFSETLLEETYCLANSKGPNFKMHLTENNPSLKWPLLL